MEAKIDVVRDQSSEGSDVPKNELTESEIDISRSLTKDVEVDLLSEEQEDVLISKQIQAQNRKKKKSGGFQSMGLSYSIYKAILHKGYKVPTPIQRKTIPLIMDGRDVVGMARTGSGKTAAFLIPMLEKLKVHSAKVGARAIILSPSRELAFQTRKVCTELAKYTNLRSCVVVGGDNLEDQFEMITGNPDIIIATPGRLLHLIVEMEMELKTIQYIVFDEADRLFELGFSVQLHEILHKLPHSRQTLLFSATLPKSLVDFAKAGLQEPTLVRLDVDTKISSDLEMAFFSVKQAEKEAALLYILHEVIKVPTATKSTSEVANNVSSRTEEFTSISHQTIVFVSTKHHVEYVANLLSLFGHQVSYIYGSLDQDARKIQINNFRCGQTNILIVTDIAARGIDIPILENVINYDFVDSSKIFVHRVGRTARAGRRGFAYSLVTPEELPYLLDLQLFLGRRLLIGSSTASTPDYTSDIIVGRFPPDSLDPYIEWVKSKLQGIHNLESLCEVSKNGYKLFCRSRLSASPESYKRSKEIMMMESYTDVHLLFANQVDANERNRLNFINSISNFRPQETIFEIGSHGNRKASLAARIMKKHRETVSKKIESHRTIDLFGAVENLNTGNKEDELKHSDITKKRKASDTVESRKKPKKEQFRDDQYYIPHYQKDANTERGYSVNQGTSFVEESRKAVMDTRDDELIDSANKKGGLRWDNKKKTFVRGGGIGSDNKKLIKTESGVKLPATYKSGRFDAWKKQNKFEIPRTGEKELSSKIVDNKRFRHKKMTAPKPLDPLAKDYEKKKRNLLKNTGDRKLGNDKDLGNFNSNNELRTVEQIHKRRKLKEKRRAKNARPSRRGKSKK
ncbi:7887_t:CDS:10 [Acaulospora morrowiae]|uniref:RNA helicase n=1 Tax=Acaulospora morrowiae TaxID=94023 RepID=A0A9N9F0L1_9GLOM|nr:7887_t:CDS:10 [Acaulospora morrowiae]